VLVGTGLEKRFGTTVALAGVDLALHRGESVAVMGPSGSGKSTLLHCLAGITRPDAGTVWLDGRRIDNLGERSRTRLRRGEFGFVFQSGQLLPELPAAENVALPLMLEGQTRRRAVERAGRWLASLGLDGLEHRRPGELSGGQAQRVAIARALVAEPAVVFADEPTAALDQATGFATVELLVGVTHDAGAALLVVTHDPGVAALCTRTVHIRDGHLVPHPPPAGTRILAAAPTAPDAALPTRRQLPDGQVAPRPADPTSTPATADRPTGGTRPPDHLPDPHVAAPPAEAVTPTAALADTPSRPTGRRRRLLGPKIGPDAATTTAATAPGAVDGPAGGTRTPGRLPGPPAAAPPVGPGAATTATTDLPGGRGRTTGNHRRPVDTKAAEPTTAATVPGAAGGAAGTPGRIRQRLGDGWGGSAATATAGASGSMRRGRAMRSQSGRAPTGTSWMTMSWGWPT
jgi:putative ABC transport system ATP-binding protein